MRRHQSHAAAWNLCLLRSPARLKRAKRSSVGGVWGGRRRCSPQLYPPPTLPSSGATVDQDSLESLSEQQKIIRTFTNQPITWQELLFRHVYATGIRAEEGCRQSDRLLGVKGQNGQPQITQRGLKRAASWAALLGRRRSQGEPKERRVFK